MKPAQTLATFGALALASSLSAQTLVQYNFVDPDSTGSLTYRTPSISGTNVITSNVANGAGVSLTNSSASGSTAGDTRSIYVQGGNASGTGVVNEPISATSTDWVGFTIQAAPGYKLNLGELSFAYAFTYSGTAPAESARFEVRFGPDYSSTVASFTANPSTTIVWQTASVGLTATTFQNLEGPVSFRIYLTDGDNTSATSYLRLDTITLSGVSQIPEPAAAAALVGLCGLGFAAARRRRSV